MALDFDTRDSIGCAYTLAGNAFSRVITRFQVCSLTRRRWNSRTCRWSGARAGRVDAPLHQIVQWMQADEILEPLGKGGSRHRSGAGKCLDCPTVRGYAVHKAERGADLLRGE